MQLQIYHFFDSERNQNQTTKDDLVKIIFITSEAMRFGSYLKYFNLKKKNRKQNEIKNILLNVQEIINDSEKNKLERIWIIIK